MRSARVGTIRDARSILCHEVTPLEILVRQNDGGSVRRTLRSVAPRLLETTELLIRRDALGGDQRFQSLQPVKIVGLAMVPRCAAERISCDRAFDHSGHVNTPRSWSDTVIANACACHGCSNTGPSASRGSPGNASRGDRAAFTRARDRVARRRRTRGAPERPRSPTIPAPQTPPCRAIEGLRLGLGHGNRQTHAGRGCVR